MRETIATLRKKVLMLAVSGQLVSQDPTEGTGEELYQAIQKARAEAAKTATGRKKNVKPLPPIAPEEIPFEIPQSWKWVHISGIAEIKGGKRLPAGAKFSDSITPHRYIRVADMKNGSVQTDTVPYITEEVQRKIKAYTLSSNDVYVSIAGSIGKIGVIPDELDGANLTENAAKLIHNINRDYLAIALRAEQLQSQFTAKVVQMAQPKLALFRIESSTIPLPPLAEQRRIVAKVDEIMQTLDALEQEANDVESVLDLLEKRILTEAVSGKLVPQDPTEGTGEELYQAIQKARAEAAKNATGRKKNAKPLPPIAPEEVPFEIPQSWKWVRLGDVGDIYTGKTPRTSIKENFNGNIPFIGPGDIQSSTICSYSKLITELGAKESVIALPGDVLMVCIGGTIGKTALVSEKTTLNQQINGLRPTLIDSAYLFRVFQSSYFYELVWQKSSGGATPILNLGRWSTSVAPLPPLAEQRRIVTKVDEAMSLIKHLREAVK